MSSQQLATLDQITPPDVTATLSERRSLKLPAFPVAPAPTESTISPPDPAAVAPDNERDLPRAEREATGNLRRFPLAAGRSRIGGHLPAGEDTLGCV
ncbi:MAG: hypothetical protein U0841_18435 [Chloroflexia bacterium]